jgi:hypothetical protein
VHTISRVAFGHVGRTVHGFVVGGERMSGPRSLAAFLLARIREDETAALDARRWYHGNGQGHGVEPGHAAGPGVVTEAFAAFLLAHEPDRVLTECTGKREIIKLVTGSGWSGSNADRDLVLLQLAKPYLGHPDFRDAWRDSPDGPPH